MIFSHIQRVEVPDASIQITEGWCKLTRTLKHSRSVDPPSPSSDSAPSTSSDSANSKASIEHQPPVILGTGSSQPPGRGQSCACPSTTRQK